MMKPPIMDEVLKHSTVSINQKLSQPMVQRTDPLWKHLQEKENKEQRPKSYSLDMDKLNKLAADPMLTDRED